MKTKLTLLLTTLILLFALTACGGGDTSLDGTAWVLTGYQGNAPIGNAPTLSFENGQASGSASCNSYGGGYTVKGNSLQVSALFRTEMYCMDPEGIMEQENAYLQLLGEADSFVLEGSTLTIRTAAGEELIFAPASE